MAQANIGSLDEVRAFRPALIRFSQDITRAVGEADTGVLRALQRLEDDIPAFWKREFVKRQEKLSQAKDAFRAKSMYKDSSGRPASAVDERVEVDRCTRAVEEAHHKIMLCKKWHQALVQQYEQFRGRVRMARDLSPMITEQAVHDFDRAITAIEAYLALQGPNTDLSSALAG